MKFWIILTTIIALFITGCTDKTPVVTKKPVQTVKETTVYVPQKVHKKGELTEVQDGNFSSAYMYPEDKVKKEKVVKVAEAETLATTANAMSKEECVSMIGLEKFDKYTQMFGNEASSIKRCAMLKAMN
jgi:hypothetical protein